MSVDEANQTFVIIIIVVFVVVVVDDDDDLLFESKRERTSSGALRVPSVVQVNVTRIVIFVAFPKGLSAWVRTACAAADFAILTWPCVPVVLIPPWPMQPPPHPSFPPTWVRQSCPMRRWSDQVKTWRKKIDPDFKVQIHPESRVPKWPILYDECGTSWCYLFVFDLIHSINWNQYNGNFLAIVHGGMYLTFSVQ